MLSRLVCCNDRLVCLSGVPYHRILSRHGTLDISSRKTLLCRVSCYGTLDMWSGERLPSLLFRHSTLDSWGWEVVHGVLTYSGMLDSAGGEIYLGSASCHILLDTSDGEVAQIPTRHLDMKLVQISLASTVIGYNPNFSAPTIEAEEYVLWITFQI